jgi:hypothetical protein
VRARHGDACQDGLIRPWWNGSRFALSEKTAEEAGDSGVRRHDWGARPTLGRDRGRKAAGLKRNGGVRNIGPKVPVQEPGEQTYIATDWQAQQSVKHGRTRNSGVGRFAGGAQPPQ